MRNASFVAGSMVLLAAFACGLPANNKNNPGFVVATGTCSGTPISCSGLSGADCSRAAGCVDRGSCTGVAVTTGEACGAEVSFVSCANLTGCFWQANCTGEVFGTCSGVTAEQCTNVPGCVWTPYAGTAGTGGGGGASVRD